MYGYATLNFVVRTTVSVFWFRFYLTICHLPFSVNSHWLYHNQVCYVSVLFTVFELAFAVFELTFTVELLFIVLMIVPVVEVGIDVIISPASIDT